MTTYNITITKRNPDDYISLTGIEVIPSDPKPVDYEIKTDTITNIEYLGVLFTNQLGYNNTTYVNNNDVNAEWVNYNLNNSDTSQELYSNKVILTPSVNTNLYIHLVGASGGGGGAGFNKDEYCGTIHFYGGPAQGGGAGAYIYFTVPLLANKQYTIFTLIGTGTVGGSAHNSNGDGGGMSAQNPLIATQVYITTGTKSEDIYIYANNGKGGQGGNKNGNTVGLNPTSGEGGWNGGYVDAHNSLYYANYSIINVQKDGITSGTSSTGDLLANCNGNYHSEEVNGYDSNYKITTPFFTQYGPGSGGCGNRMSSTSGGNFGGGRGGGSTESGQISALYGGGGGGGAPKGQSAGGGKGGQGGWGFVILYLEANSLKEQYTPTNISYIYENLKSPFLRGNSYLFTSATTKYYVVGRSQTSNQYYYLIKNTENDTNNLLFTSSNSTTILANALQISISQQVSTINIFKFNAIFNSGPYPISANIGNTLYSYSGNTATATDLYLTYSNALNKSKANSLYPGVWVNVTDSSSTQYYWNYVECSVQAEPFCTTADTSVKIGYFDIMLIPVNTSTTPVSKWIKGTGCTPQTTQSESIGLEWFSSWILKDEVNGPKNCDGDKMLSSTTDSNNCYFTNNNMCEYNYLYSVEELATSCNSNLGLCPTTAPICIYNNTTSPHMLCTVNGSVPPTPVPPTPTPVPNPADTDPCCTQTDNTLFVLLIVFIIIGVIIGCIVYFSKKNKREEKEKNINYQ